MTTTVLLLRIETGWTHIFVLYLFPLFKNLTVNSRQFDTVAGVLS